MNSTQLLKTALAGALTLGVASFASAGSMAQGGSMAAQGKMMGSMDKCYGINAANKNDCQSPGHSCAGQDSKARDPNAFVAVPKGLCEKIEGGSLKPAGA